MTQYFRGSLKLNMVHSDCADATFIEFFEFKLFANDQTSF